MSFANFAVSISSGISASNFPKMRSFPMYKRFHKAESTDNFLKKVENVIFMLFKNSFVCQRVEHNSIFGVFSFLKIFKALKS